MTAQAVGSPSTTLILRAVYYSPYTLMVSSIMKVIIFLVLIALLACLAGAAWRQLHKKKEASLNVELGGSENLESRLATARKEGMLRALLSS
jgi:hypothetical protein